MKTQDEIRNRLQTLKAMSYMAGELQYTRNKEAIRILEWVLQ
jgi:hypothetical protein